MSEEDISICIRVAFLVETESKKCALPCEYQAERLGTVFSFNASAPQCLYCPLRKFGFVGFYFPLYREVLILTLVSFIVLMT